MIRLNSNLLKVIVRCVSTNGCGYPESVRTTLPRRPIRKIPVGKARPAIYYQFDVAVALTDGSVVIGRSQYPQDEIRLIQDQRNNPFWNPSGEDLVEADPNSVGNIEKFKQRYGGMFNDSNDLLESSSIEKKGEKIFSSKVKNIESKETSNVKGPTTRNKKQISTTELDDFLDFLDETDPVPSKKK